MRKRKSSPADVQHLRSALVRDGITTYPLAMQAIAEFRHEILTVLDRVARSRKKTISQILGDVMFKPDSHEVDDFLDGPDTWLCVSTTGPCSFQIYVLWQDVDRDESPVRI